MAKQENDGQLLTFGGHLEVLRRMIFRIVVVTGVLAVLIFCFKKETFTILLAPTDSSFITFDLIQRWITSLGFDFRFEQYHISLISTELSSQFMTHISVSCLLAFLLASPYIVFELFRFITPALYEREKKYSVLVAFIIYILFIIGLMMSYFVIFPISFRFLANYQVDESVVNTITLSSYISTFTTLTFIMGVVFQLPIFTFILGKMGLIDYQLLRRYRSYAFIIILIVSAIITPPDIFTLILVALPLYALYEVSILVLKKWGPEPDDESDIEARNEISESHSDEATDEVGE